MDGSGRISTQLLVVAITCVLFGQAHLCHSEIIDHPETRFFSVGESEEWEAGTYDLAPEDPRWEATLDVEWGAGAPHPSFHITTRLDNRLLYAYMEHEEGSEYNWNDVEAWRQGTTMSPPLYIPEGKILGIFQSEEFTSEISSGETTHSTVLNVKDTLGEIFRLVLQLPPTNDPNPTSTEPTGPTKKTSIGGLEEVPVIVPLPDGKAELLGYLGWTNEIDTVFAVKIKGGGTTVLNKDSELEHLLIESPSTLKVVGERRLEVDAILQSEGTILLTPDSTLQLEGHAEMIGPDSELYIQQGAFLRGGLSTVELTSGAAMTMDVSTRDDDDIPHTSYTKASGDITIDEDSTLTTRFEPEESDEPGESPEPDTDSRAIFYAGTITNDNLITIDAPTEFGSYGHLVNNARVEINSSLETVVNSGSSITNNGFIHVAKGARLTADGGLISDSGLKGTGTIQLDNAMLSGQLLAGAIQDVRGTGTIDMEVQGQINLGKGAEFSLQGEVSEGEDGERGKYIITEGSRQYVDGELTNDGLIEVSGSDTQLDIEAGGRVRGNGEVHISGENTKLNVEAGGSFRSGEIELTSGAAMTMDVSTRDDDENPHTSYTSVGGNITIDEESTLTTRFEPEESDEPGESPEAETESRAIFYAGTITNNNLITIDAPTELHQYGHLVNNETVEINSSLETVVNSGSSITNNGLMRVVEGGYLVSDGALTGNGTIMNHGTTVLGGVSEVGCVYNSGELTINSTLDFDEIVLADGSITGPSFEEFVVGHGSVLRGNGTINGDVYNEGFISPGFSPGLLEIDGDLSLAPSCVLEMEIYGGGLSEYDRILVTGELALGGSLLVTLGDTAVFDAGWTFDLLTAESFTGDFADILLPDLYGSPLFSYGWFGDSFRLTSLEAYDGTTQVVPLPSAVLLGGIGVAAAGWNCRRKARRGRL